MSVSGIRDAKESDSSALARLSIELGYPASTGIIADRLQKLTAGPGQAIFVADDGAVVGWIHVAVVLSLESDMFAEIRGLVVAESHRNSGIGTRLVEAAERWALSKTCRRIRVRTNMERERTRAFYRKMGFQSSKTQEVFDKKLQAEKV